MTWLEEYEANFEWHPTPTGVVRRFAPVDWPEDEPTRAEVEAEEAER